MKLTNDEIYAVLYNEAILGSCMYRKYAAAIKKDDNIIGVGHAQTADASPCTECERFLKIQTYGKISEFFEFCNVIHAEICAMLNCKSRDEIPGSELYLLGLNSDGSIYSGAFPCDLCYRTIKYQGIKAINVFESNKKIVRSEVV